MATSLTLAAFALAAAWFARRVFVGYPPDVAVRRVLARRSAAFVAAAGDATFPAGGAIPASGSDADLVGYVDRWIAAVPPSTRLLMHLLFFLVEHATLVFPASGSGGRSRFSSLSLAQRSDALDGWRTSRLFARRLVFTSLRAILTMGYFSHPPVLRQLRVAPLDIRSPICEADTLYPPIGAPTAAIRHTRADITEPSSGTPLDLDGPLHPDYAEESA